MELVGSTPESEKFLEEWSSDKPYVIVHTSGSTGEPKEIKLPKSDMIASARATIDFFGIRKGDTLLCPLSTNYIAGKMMIVRAIISGARLIIEHPSNTPFKAEYGKIKLMPVVPSQIAGIKRESFRYIENLLVGGAPVTREQERSICLCGANAFMSYGMTETASHVALRKIGEGDIYKALPGITFDVDRDSCLNINAPSFSFNMLQTNDVVELMDSTSFRWLGRRDNVVNSGGIKLHPEAIEKKICDLIDGDYYIIGEPDYKWGERLVMYVEGAENDMLMECLRLRLSPVECPKEIRFVRQLSRTDSGKVRRRLL